MQLLCDGQSCLVLCDKSTVGQWANEVRRFLGCNTGDFKKIRVRIQHYEALDDPNAPLPAGFDMIIVDEAHRFRNAWQNESARMLDWMQQIHSCSRVIFMSGTPYVHDVAVEERALHEMMRSPDVSGRIFYYDPRSDTKKAHHYAHTDEEIVECHMSWAQCFRYLMHRKQNFVLQLDGEHTVRERVSSCRNTYNTLLRSICNCPFPEQPDLSPKMTTMIARMSQHVDKKQVVYSSRRDTGVTALMQLWTARSSDTRAVFRVDGTMSQQARTDNINAFNRRAGGVLFITDAGGQGIDLKRVEVMHIMEPVENVQEERQVVNRAVRFKAHRDKQTRVLVLRYIAKFPISGRVAPPWKRELYESGLFSKGEMIGITRSVQYALRRIVRDEESGMTIDEKTVLKREERHGRIQEALMRLKKSSI